MFRKKTSFLLAVLLLAPLMGALGLHATPTGVVPDEVLVRYPEGFSKVLVADIAKLLTDPVLAEAVIGPLNAARHPLNGIAQVIQDTLELPPQFVSYVAHGTGPGLSGLSLVQGPPEAATFGPLFGLQFAVGAPMSPFTNWELTRSNGLPVIRTGGTFGPVQIQWAYAFEPNSLWVGTETSFGPPPDVDRLAATIDSVTARARGQGAYFDELLVALNVSGRDLAFVRQTDAALDRPTAAGEQTLGFGLTFTPQGAEVVFNVRFAGEAAAAAALAELEDGTSPYLTQDLYQGELLEARQIGRELMFTVLTTLGGAVGLLLVAMPN